jgi:hypothetical protein
MHGDRQQRVENGRPASRVEHPLPSPDLPFAGRAPPSEADGITVYCDKFDYRHGAYQRPKLARVKTRPSPGLIPAGDRLGLPDADSLVGLRAWYAGLSPREAVARYLDPRKAEGESARGILGRARRQLAACARQMRRDDLAALFSHSESERASVRARLNEPASWCRP